MPVQGLQGPLAGYLQGMQDIEATKQAPQRTRLLTAQAGEQELKYKREKMMMDAMSRYGIQGDTPSDKMRFMGNLAIDSGDPETARRLFDSASMVDSRGEAAKSAASRRQLTASTIELRNIDLQGRLFGQATDQKSFDTANAYYYALTGQVSPYAGQPFSKALADQITKNALTTKDRITKDLDARKTKSLEDIRDARTRDIDDLIRHRRVVERIAQQRADRIGKAGAGVKDPTRDLQTQAMRKIKESYPDLGTDAETLSNAAFAIASDAQALKRNNQALTADEALGKAFKNAVERGDFKASARPRIPYTNWEYGQGKTKYSGSGRTAETAIPLPQGADTSKLEKGHYYVDGGVTAKWDPDDPEADGGWVYPESAGAAEDEGAMLEEGEE